MPHLLVLTIYKIKMKGESIIPYPNHKTITVTKTFRVMLSEIKINFPLYERFILFSIAEEKFRSPAIASNTVLLTEPVVE